MENAGMVWTEEQLTALAKLAFTSAWNGARNFPDLDVDSAWQDFVDYLATHGAEGA